MAYHSTDAIMGYAQPQTFTPTISLHDLTIKAFLNTRLILRKVKFIADSKELTFSYEFNISWYAPVWMIQELTSPLHIPKEDKFKWIRIPGGLKFLPAYETAYRVTMSQKLKALVCVGMNQNLKLVCVVVNPNPKYAKAKTNSKCFGMPGGISSSFSFFLLFNKITQYFSGSTHPKCEQFLKFSKMFVIT